MKINGNNTIALTGSGGKLSPKLSQLPRITSYPWATEKLLSDYRKPLCKKEISQKSAFINKEMAAPLNNPYLSVKRAGTHRKMCPFAWDRWYADISALRLNP
jgi:hypothetical protein